LASKVPYERVEKAVVMHIHALPHQHHHVNYTLLGMSAGVIVVPTFFLAMLFLMAHFI